MFDLENFPTRELAKDMMSMISPIYDNSYVGKWIFEVMSVPLSLAQDTINELREQVFPETSTWSLPYWEQSYGLPTNEALSIEERRSRVISKRNCRKPMNPARIEMLLKELCGRDVKLIENTAPHTFEISVSPGTSEASLDQIIKLVNEVKQAQKSFRVVFDTPTTIKIRADPQPQKFPYRMTARGRKAGTYPQVNWVGISEHGSVIVTANRMSREFPYVVAGTKPDRAYNARLTALQLQASSEGKGVEFPYPISGTKPDRSFLAEIEPGALNVQVDSTNAEVLYRACGSKRKL